MNLNDRTIKAAHLTTIGIFVIIALYALSLWINEYRNIQDKRQSLIEKVVQLRDDIYQEALEFKDQVEKWHHEYNLRQEEDARRAQQARVNELS